jgi:high affinity Mn2+ porin
VAAHRSPHRSSRCEIIEAYYSRAAFSFAHVTADYQFVNDPAYNRQRGPISVFGLRLHGQF